MGKYDAAIATARRIIAAKGAATTIMGGDVKRDPVTQAVIGGAVAPMACHAVGLPPGKSAEKVIGSLVDRNIQQFYIATKAAAQPKPGQRIEWAGEVWTLVWTATYDPAAEGAIFTEAYGER